jgi:hypothetical protein
MKAVCIHCCSKSLFNPDTYKFHLTQGKTYEVIDSKQTPEKERPHMYKIINDDDKQRWYDKSMFITLEEWRDQQLNEILKDV